MMCVPLRAFAFAYLVVFGLLIGCAGPRHRLPYPPREFYFQKIEGSTKIGLLLEPAPIKVGQATDVGIYLTDGETGQPVVSSHVEISWRLADYPAVYESTVLKPDAPGYYVGEVSLPKAGRYIAEVSARIGDKLVASSMPVRMDGERKEAGGANTAPQKEVPGAFGGSGHSH